MTTALAVPPDNRVTLFGFRNKVGLLPPPGVIVAKRSTVPVNPPMLVRVIVKLPEFPALIASGEGVAVIENSGEEGLVTVRKMETLW